MSQAKLSPTGRLLPARSHRVRCAVRVCLALAVLELATRSIVLPRRRDRRLRRHSAQDDRLHLGRLPNAVEAMLVNRLFFLTIGKPHAVPTCVP